MERGETVIDHLGAASLVDFLPIGVVIVDSTGKIIFLNAELSRMTGHEKSSLIGKNIDTLVPDRNREGHARDRAAFMQAPEIRHMGAGRELFARRADGSEFPVDVGLRPMTIGAQKAVMASVVDVSARRDLERGFQAIVASAPYGLVLVDADGRITMTNPQLDTMFGYSDRELEGKPIETLIPVRQHKNHHQYRANYAAAPTTRVMGAGRDLTGLRKDGVEIPVEVGLSAVQTPAGPAVMASIADITLRKRAEMRLREANGRLEEFAYVVSHDLRSPLRGISNLIDFIHEDYGNEAPESVLTNLQRMRERVRRTEALIEDLLSYAQSSYLNFFVEEININSIVDEIISIDPPPSHFSIVVNNNSNPFKGVKAPISTIIRNLYSNAIKHHGKKKGKIEIHAQDDGDFCVVDFRDDGPGIPAEARERIFKLFQTLAPASGNGTGLGLAVARNQAEMHGGRIQLIPEPDRVGSCFRVTWPRVIRADFGM
ncbi:MAG: PAS domain-containing sensor histidine kinase [Proteobacteria bacterium]|nr:PAS domain-containing sensor histidine kinase [Pseudomonadota bacterium]